ncbi:MAG: hypothetical protein AAFO06_08065 [Cyanobacteria bacterium J06597_16]
MSRIEESFDEYCAYLAPSFSNLLLNFSAPLAPYAMHQLSPFTCRRLSQLPRLTSAWECDRRPLASSGQPLADGLDAPGGDCIMWVDSLQGIIRGLSVVPKDTGNEAIVRTLMQAIESPQGEVEPARPRKVVVCDREIQFFLRGALQDLDIPVEHAPTLPMIDEIFQKIQTPPTPEVTLPKAFEQTLLQKAALLWTDAPWNYLSEQEILAIELNCWEIETLYLSILGLAGMEYGLLFYRDLDSLEQFRRKLLTSDDFSEGMQQAFLEQNCLFINFNPATDVLPMPSIGKAAQIDSAAAVGYEFGSLHPLEGLRSQLAEEEAASLIVALEALHRFLKKHDIGAEDFALRPVTSRFRIPNPAKATASRLNPAGENDKGLAKGAKPNGRKAKGSKTKNLKKGAIAQTLDAVNSLADSITVKISTVPEVSMAFLEETMGPDPLTDAAPLIDDSVPEGSLIMLGAYPDKQLKPLREQARIHYQSFLTPPKKRPARQAQWPILTIQTTRPKAQKLVQLLQQEGGVHSICFNPGSDPMSGQVFQVGLLQTASGQLHLFNEYEVNSSADSRYLTQWAARSHQNHQCCGCIIAAGATGAHRGKPTQKEVVAFFEVLDTPPEEIGLAPLVMSYVMD